MVSANDNRRPRGRRHQPANVDVIGAPAPSPYTYTGTYTDGQEPAQTRTALVRVTDDFGGPIAVRLGEVDLLASLLQHALAELQDRAANDT